MDRLTALGAFMQSAEAGSFAAAGRQLGISPSAVGKSISRLEDRLRVRLFHRSTRNITLTAEGTQFLGRCVRIFDEIEAAELELTQANATACGRLKINLPLIGLQLTDALCGFAKAYPRVALDLDFSDHDADIFDEGFDVLLRIGDVADSMLMTKALGDYGLTIIGAPDYFARHGQPLVPEDLAAHVCLHQRNPASGKLDSWPLRGVAGVAALNLPVTTVASTVEPLLRMAVQGLGLACVPHFMAGPHIDAGRLQPVLNNHLECANVIRLLWPSSRHLSPKIKAFVDYMAQQAKAALLFNGAAPARLATDLS
jgi:DNA-binding transcriptional LysR family regulator